MGSLRSTILCTMHLIIYASITFCFKPSFNFKLFNGNNFSFDLFKDKTIEHSLQRLHFIVTSSIPFKEDPILTSKNIATDIPSKQDRIPEATLENISLFPSRLKIKQQSENVDVTIREAAVNDLGAIANLRVSVFYPEVC